MVDQRLKDVFNVKCTNLRTVFNILSLGAGDASVKQCKSWDDCIPSVS
jgi:hypothetical protein